MQYIRTSKGQARCPITGIHMVPHLLWTNIDDISFSYFDGASNFFLPGCPKTLEEERVVCDPLLRIEIDEATSKQTARDDIEDFTNLNDEDEESG